MDRADGRSIELISRAARCEFKFVSFVLQSVYHPPRQPLQRCRQGGEVGETAGREQNRGKTPSAHDMPGPASSTWLGSTRRRRQAARQRVRAGLHGAVAQRAARRGAAREGHCRLRLQGGQRTPMPRFMVDAFGETFRLQEREMRRARARIWGCRRGQALERGDVGPRRCRRGRRQCGPGRGVTP